MGRHRAHMESHLRPGWPMRGEHRAWVPTEVNLRHSTPESGSHPWLCLSLPPHAISCQVLPRLPPGFLLSLFILCSCILPTTTLIQVLLSLMERPSWRALTKALWPVLCTATRISFTLGDPHKVQSQPRALKPSHHACLPSSLLKVKEPPFPVSASLLTTWHLHSLCQH